MKRFVAAALAFSMLGSPLAMADQPPPPPGQWHGEGRPPPPPPGYRHGGPDHHDQYRHNSEYYHHNSEYYHHDAEYYHHHPYDHGRPPPPPPRYGWGRGYRVPPGHHYYPVNDWHRYRGLYAPPPGQQWVQYNNQFYLVAITSGIIGAVIGAAAASQ